MLNLVAQKNVESIEKEGTGLQELKKVIKLYIIFTHIVTIGYIFKVLLNMVKATIYYEVINICV